MLDKSPKAPSKTEKVLECLTLKLSGFCLIILERRKKRRKKYICFASYFHSKTCFIDLSKLVNSRQIKQLLQGRDGRMKGIDVFFTQEWI